MTAPAEGFDPSRAAMLLRAARRARRMLDRLPDDAAPRTEREGAEVQRALAALDGALPPAGFKIGATARTMQDYLGLAGPAAGFMAEAGLRANGAEMAFAGFLNPGLECELAVRLARDLRPAPCTEAEAASAVGEVFAAIELVERRYRDLAAFGTPAMIADQVFHAGAVLGDPVANWRDLDLAELAGRITVDGTERGHGRGGDLLGHPMRALAWLAGSDVAAAFGGLRAGQVVLLGSVTPPIWLDGPCAATVEFTSMLPVHLRLG